MLKTFINKIKLLVKIFFLEVEEPLYVLPISFTTALNKIGSWEDYGSYKVYFFQGSSLLWKVRIDKVFLGEDSSVFQYTYSWFYKNIKLTKYTEEKYEFFFNTFKNKVLSLNEKYLQVRGNESYEELEELFIEEKNNEKKEFLLDCIFKNYPDKLFQLKESIFSKDSSFDFYIRTYYSQLLKLLFDYTDYNQLVLYYNDIESFYSEDEKIEDLKEDLIKKIQDKNLLEAEIERNL